MFTESLLEKRARLLADRAKQQAVTGGKQLGTTDKRPPFHDMLSPREALTFWTKHRYDPIGQSVLSTWSPIDVARLDAWLGSATQITHPQLQPFQLPSGQSLITQGMSAERRIEGPELGPAVA